MTQILAGPAIRRTDETQINLWLVLKQDASVRATAYSDPQGTAIGTGSTVECPPVQMGQNLFFYLIRVTPHDEDGFPTDQKIYYDVEIDGDSLRNSELITASKPIVYPGEPLPSIIIPTKHRHIIQGSCRKPHAKESSGVGQKDQLTHVDTILCQSVNSIGERPTMLVLTGDQIYADDVATPLLAVLNRKGAELVGRDEEMPSRHRRKSSEKPGEILLYGRDRVLYKREGFTSTTGWNHLMTFGEFVAMYLTVWGGIEVDLPTWSAVKDRIATHAVPIPGGKGRKTRQEEVISEGAYQSEKNCLEQFLASCWKVRRLMANVPTYMMFDDHEVTDDWNLNAEIQERLAAPGSLGRRLTSNALAAYWACQGWGNDPDAFDGQFKDALSDFYFGLDPDKADAAEEALQSRNWSYSVPGYPALIALDTRTDRSYNAKRAPKLISAKGFKWLNDQLEKFGVIYRNDRNIQTLLLLSPAPVFGFKPLELSQGKIVNILKGFDTVVDAEYWSADEPTYEAFLSVLSEKGFTDDLIFLSGDVHYSYGAVSAKEQGSVRFIQITSSATCNELPGFMATIMGWIERKMHTPPIPYLFPKGETVVANSHNSIGSVRFEEGRVIEATEHFVDPMTGAQYRWVYDLRDPEVRPT